MRSGFYCLLSFVQKYIATQQASKGIKGNIAVADARPAAASWVTFAPDSDWVNGTASIALALDCVNSVTHKPNSYVNSKGLTYGAMLSRALYVRRLLFCSSRRRTRTSPIYDARATVAQINDNGCTKL